MAISAKRVDIVSLKMVKESSRLYKPRHINTPLDAAALIRDLLADSDREKIMAICLDSKNQPTCITTVSIGTLTSSTAHPREIFKTAIISNAQGLFWLITIPQVICLPRERVCQDDFCKFSKFKYLSAEKSPNISCLHIS